MERKGRTEAKHQSPHPPRHDLRNGRDEMNLVEFPFALLSDRGGGVLVLVFQVEDRDRATGLRVNRKLTVTGDPKHGLPTAKDEEVYLGLLQLTKLKTEFNAPVVRFTRCELIALLGWPNTDWAYERVVTAFARLAGVRLFYQKAWRDNADKAFKDRGGFGLLDSYRFRDGRKGRGQNEDRLSEFRWNSVLFDSFQAGYLKRLDYETVRSLGTKAKRLYRYLDKHFNPPKYARLTFDLRTLACEHLGLSRDYDACQIRRQLRPAIDELERIGFVVPAGDAERYRKLGRGRWDVTFVRGGGPATGVPKITSASKPRRTLSSPEPDKDGERVDSYLFTLGPAARTALEADALAEANPFVRSQLGDDGSTNGPLATVCRRMMIRTHVLKLLEIRGPLRPA